MSEEQKARSRLTARQQSYRKLFDTDEGETLLKDLAKFCRAHESTYNEDARMSAILEGRREVFLRIQQHLKLTDDEIWNLYR